MKKQLNLGVDRHLDRLRMTEWHPLLISVAVYSILLTLHPHLQDGATIISVGGVLSK